jgi:hypothetical protein
MSNSGGPQGSKWLARGDEENPFDCVVLDCRHFADTMMSFTSDPQVVANFFGLRNTRSDELAGMAPVEPLRIEGDFSIARSAPLLDGPLFVAPEMEYKWDFYSHESKLYVRRSWTGQIIHVAEVEWDASGGLAIGSIVSGSEFVYGNAEYAKAQLHFLLSTHLGRQLKPFPIATWQENEDAGVLTIQAFSAYGRMARFGCRLSDYRFD